MNNEENKVVEEPTNTEVATPTPQVTDKAEAVTQEEQPAPIKESGTATQEEIDKSSTAEKEEVLDEYELEKDVEISKNQEKKNIRYMIVFFGIIFIFIALLRLMFLLMN